MEKPPYSISCKGCDQFGSENKPDRDGATQPAATLSTRERNSVRPGREFEDLSRRMRQMAR